LGENIPWSFWDSDVTDKGTQEVPQADDEDAEQSQASATSDENQNHEDGFVVSTVNNGVREERTIPMRYSGNTAPDSPADADD
jgi:hypothetical protein